MEPEPTDLPIELISSGPTPAQQIRGTALMCAVSVWSGTGLSLTSRQMDPGVIVDLARQFEAYLRGDDDPDAEVRVTGDPLDGEPIRVTREELLAGVPGMVADRLAASKIAGNQL